jgi:hypothetical protein
MKEQDLKLKIAELKDTIVYLRKELELIKNKNKMENKETLEEAAESRYGTDMDSYRGGNIFDQNTDLKRGFVQGAKWQADRMYSEEEVKLILQEFKRYLSFGDEVPESEWFEQFKKK